MTSSRRILAVCSFLLVGLPGVASAQRTAADLESARELYNQGIALRDKGDLKGALEKFRAAHALGNTPITGLELCKTYGALNQPVEARETCLGVARIPPLAQETPRSRDARTEAAKVADDQIPKISTLRLVIKGVPAGREATVTCDGIAVPAAALGEPRAVDPGVHVITARVGGGAETRATLETHPGESRDLELAVQPPPPGETAPPPPAGGAQQQPQGQPWPEKHEKKNTFATVSFITAGAAAAIGTVTGIVALVKKGDLTDKCPQKACGVADHDSLDSARGFGTASTVFFVVAGVALGAGILATVTSGSSKTSGSTKPTITPVIGLGGAGVHGTF